MRSKLGSSSQQAARHHAAALKPTAGVVIDTDGDARVAGRGSPQPPRSSSRAAAANSIVDEGGGATLYEDGTGAEDGGGRHSLSRDTRCGDVARFAVTVRYNVHAHVTVGTTTHQVMLTPN